MEDNMTKVTDHIDAVIAAIKAEDRAVLSMGSYVGEINPDSNKHGCGTSACIAGFSQMVSAPPEFEFGSRIVHPEIEGPKFGLNQDDADELFLGMNNRNVSLHQITNSMAIAALQDVRETGRFTGWDDYA
jgi:hypothetical protein